MIGIEYILNVFEITQQELADELKIKKQNVSRWCKGDRNIPEKYLDILKEKFNIPREYFNMKLKKSDELKIDLIKLVNENKNEIIKTIQAEEIPINEFLGQFYNKKIERDFVLLKSEIEKQELLEDINTMINIKFDADKNNIAEYKEEFRKINGVFSYIVDILKSGKVEPDVLMEIFNAIVLAYGIEEGIDHRPLVRLLIAALQFHKFDKNLKYSVLKTDIQEE